MKLLILHRSSLYAAIILLMAGIMQYSHHHHHTSFENAVIVFNHSAHSCHHHTPTEEKSDADHCALHLAHMMEKDDSTVSTQIITAAIDVILIKQQTSSPELEFLCENNVERPITIRPRIFIDFTYSRGSPESYC